MANYWLEPTAAGTMVGWQPQPPGRGTFGIITSSAQTLILCAWVSICVNAPSPHRGSRDLLRDKFYLMLLALLGPELVFGLALMQYFSARESVTLFQELGKHDWTLTHGFYADMGGIHVQPPSWKRFPVTGKQLHYLVSKGFMSYPRIPLEEIKAKNKADGLARCITIAQILYFTIVFFARVEQGLAVSTLELTVMGFIFCMLATSVCWWRKPNDVMTSHVFDLTSSIEDILREAGGIADLTYLSTPLDFAGPEQWNVANLWLYYTNILRHLGLFRDRHPERPVQKFGSLNWPRPRSQFSLFIVFLLSLGYACIFLGAWNFGFPSRIESVTWRAVALTQSSITLLAGGFEIYNYGTLGIQQSMSTHKSRTGEKHVESCIAQIKSDFRRLWNKPCNNSISRYYLNDIPLKSLIIMTPLCAIYVICRWYLLAEDIVGLRALPENAYQDVDWTRYIPTL